VADNGSKAKSEVPMWTVVDTNCKASETRTHAIMVDGQERPYTFKYAEDLPMPEAHARKFVHDLAFDVKNADGRRIKPAIPITKGFDGRFTLDDDQCVARLDELSMESLLDRAAPLPGGEKLSLKSGKAAVIKFLIDARKKKLTQNLSPEKRETDGETDEMSAAELQRMAELEAA